MNFATQFSPTRPLAPWVWWLLLISAVGLFLYSLCRAATLSMTFDEVWSLNTYAHGPWAGIIQFRPVGANNHLGNSLLMKLMLYVSDSPISLRLPNVIAHGIYIAFSIALARRLRQGVWVLLLYFLLNFQPYLLDFFSLARGYGLAMAMVMGALYHLYAFRENAFTRHLGWNMVFAVLSVIFNLSSLHFFLADAVVLTLLIYSHAHAWDHQWKTALRTAILRFSPILIATLGLYLLLASPIKALVDAKELYYGGSQGFWSDTVFSLAHALMYKIDYWRYDIEALRWFGLLSLFGMLLAFCIEVSEARFSLRASPGMLAFLLMLIPAVTCTLQHFTVGSLFLIYRTALFLLPIYMLGLVWLLRTVARVQEFRKAVIGISVLIVLLLGMQNFQALNFTHCAEWPFDADTKSAIADLKADAESHGNRPDHLTLGLSWHLRPVANYYREQDRLGWLDETTQVGCQPGFDYYFVLNDGEGCKLLDAELPFGKNQGYILLKKYPVSNTALWRSH